MFNKIRFENKINIEMWGSFEILESYVGETVIKIRFVGNIIREIRVRLSVRTFWRKREKNQRREKRPMRAAISAILR